METQGKFIIQGLWEIHTDAIIDVIFGDSDADIIVRNQWKISSVGGIRKIEISMVSISTSNEKIFICPLSGWHARIGVPCHTHKFEPTHGGNF